MKVAIIGGGLAGTACAYLLQRSGLEPVIYEAGSSLASGGSGNRLGLYNPRLSAEYTSEAEYYTKAFELALEVFPKLEDVDWHACGSLHLITDEKRGVRFPKTVKNWPWGEDMLRLVDAEEASVIAGVTLTHEALYLPQAGMVSPKKLCAAYAQEVDERLNTQVESLDELEEDVVIIASGVASAQLFDLPIKAVRGQVTYVQDNELEQNLRCNLCYGGYLSPSVDGVHVLGSSFQRWLDHSDILAQDDVDNLEKLNAVAPALAEGLEVVGQWAGVRATSPDHFPIVGQAQEGVYISAAHGSHGILSSLLAAHEISAMIQDASGVLSQEALTRCSPARFLHP